MAKATTTRTTRRRPLLAALAALAAALSAAGCVSMPTGGPVLSYPVTQGPDAQNQPYVQIVPQEPQPGWSPAQVVQGFLTASASFGDYAGVADDYLTPGFRPFWTRSWSAIVYKTGPKVEEPAALPSSSKGPVTVHVTGQEQAHLVQSGSYSVPSASASNEANQQFTLVKVGKEWRISSAPTELLLTSDSFSNDYQLRNLYFLDPSGQRLVPDPIYVPLRGDLMNGLVEDLIKPPGDWLSGSGATRTALPPGTKLKGVTFSGVTAVVNLTGTITKATKQTMQQVSDQLLHTLADPGPSGPGEHPVQSIEIERNGQPWSPPGSQNNPVQPYSKKQAAANPLFYFVDSAGYLNSQNGPKAKAVRGLRIGANPSSVAVSPSGDYLAVLRGSTLYTGRISGPLARRGTGYLAVSWDVNDNLWASVGDQVVVFRNQPARSPQAGKEPLSQQVTVHVTTPDAGDWPGPYPALRVAPDGVRVAIVVSGGTLALGAISGQLGQSPRITLSPVQLNPPSGTAFTGLTWYGPDNVIALANPGPSAVNYSVSGGTSTPLPVDPGMRSITASYGNLLIAGMPQGSMASDVSPTGVWTKLGAGYAPAYPG